MHVKCQKAFLLKMLSAWHDALGHEEAEGSAETKAYGEQLQDVGNSQTSEVRVAQAVK